MASNSRNTRRRLIRNTSRQYADLFKRKKKTGINQWATPITRQISSARNAGIMEISHIWKTGDRYYKLAATHYGNPEYWWIIASYNQVPTEGHLRIGDVIFIPTPLNRLLEIL